jgi:hypothetical protein
VGRRPEVIRILTVGSGCCFLRRVNPPCHPCVRKRPRGWELSHARPHQACARSTPGLCLRRCLAARRLWWGQPEGTSRAVDAGEQPLRTGGEQPVSRGNGLDTGQLVLCVRYLPGQFEHLGAGGPCPASAARSSSSAFARSAGSSLAIRSGKRACCLLASRPLRRSSGGAGLSVKADSRTESVSLENSTRAVYSRRMARRRSTAIATSMPFCRLAAGPASPGIRADAGPHPS